MDKTGKGEGTERGRGILEDKSYIFYDFIITEVTVSIVLTSPVLVRIH